MQKKRRELAALIQNLAPHEGLNAVALPGVHCIKFSRITPPAEHHWRATLGIVAQGCKEIGLGIRHYRYDAAHYIATPIDLPVTSQVVKASKVEPFLCLRLDFDLQIVSVLSAQMDPVPLRSEASHPALYQGAAEDNLIDAALRLVKLLDRPKDVQVLGPLIKKEIFYHLLQSANGSAIRQFVNTGSARHRIYAAVHRLHSQLHQSTDITALAAESQMSRSAFFKAFKEVTSMSPLQYQKRLRLIEARRLMREENENAEQSAYRVGYESPSQFSREYTRFFGNAPGRDTRQQRFSSC
jgi:AraC-like DNA-binding protein